ncbi:hypothetical protein [Alteraurantiacibacter palmitatis]|uniref:Transcriptional regulator n=1 Tax=Alteraurantiacibacter palmitatis TaxID=2054628 RepID=A0ABV7E7E3_9SPHN
MTKRRAPLSPEAALARIAGHLPNAWDDMAEALGKSASYLRQCGDPDRREQLSVTDAIALDLAYARAGGQGYPLRESYDAQLQIAEAECFGDRFSLLCQVETLITEAGQAHAALVRLVQPGSGEQERRIAARELAENFEALRPLLALLDAGAPVSPRADLPRERGPPG